MTKKFPPVFEVRCRDCGMLQSAYVRLCMVRSCWSCGSKKVVGKTMKWRNKG